MTPQQQQAVMALARTRTAPQAQGPMLGQGGQMRPMFAFGGGDLHGKLHQRPISHTGQMFGHNLNPLSGGMHRLGMTNPYSSRPHFDIGGMPQAALANMRATQQHKRAPNGDPIHTGPIRSPVAGRTDHLAMSVPSGSYVIPADVVNHLGQDNSEAGHAILEGLFRSDAIRKLHEKPGVKPFGQHLPIAAAGGEYVVAPEAVAHRGGGSIQTGHRVLDKFVLDKRHEHINNLKKMPGPQK